MFKRFVAGLRASRANEAGERVLHVGVRPRVRIRRSSEILCDGLPYEHCDGRAAAAGPVAEIRPSLLLEAQVRRHIARHCDIAVPRY